MAVREEAATVQPTTDKQFLKTNNKYIVTISPIEKNKTRKRNGGYRKGCCIDNDWKVSLRR